MAVHGKAHHHSSHMTVKQVTRIIEVHRSFVWRGYPSVTVPRPRLSRDTDRGSTKVVIPVTPGATNPNYLGMRY